MAFKKEQVLKNAEKLVARGKIEAAIKEYRKVLAKVGDDTNTHNRIGDLYARLRNNDGAIKHYGHTADSYAKDGFYVKAIAVYKKIDRLEPGRIEVHSKLAELYERQGLVKNARDHFQHLADHYQRQSDAAAAIGVYQKMVDLEPDNPSHHAKLAELYRQEKLPAKALREYGSIAAQMLSHRQVDQAVQVYLRALDIDAGDLDFLKEATTALHGAGAEGAAAAEQLLSAAMQRNPEAERLRPVDVEVMAGTAEQVAAPEGLSATGSQPVAIPVPEPPESTSPATETLVPETAVESTQESPVAQAPPPVSSPPEAAREAPSPAPPAAETPTPTPAVSDSQVSSASAEAPAEAEATGDDFEEFVLDFDDDEAPASLVTPPPDMLEGSEAPIAVEDEIELVLEDGGAAAQAEVHSVADTGPVTETPPSLRDSGASEPVDWDFEPEPDLESPPLEPEDVELELAVDDSQMQPAAAPSEPGSPPVAESDSPPGVTDSQSVGTAAPTDDAVSETQPSMAEQPMGSITGTHGQQVIRREDDLLAEAEVFVKYGLHEKAVDRLQEVLSINPRHLAAHSQLIALFLEQGVHDRVATLSAEMAEMAQEKGAGDSWAEMRQTLEAAGFGFDGDQITALPGAEAPGDAAAAPAAEVPAEVPVEAPAEVPVEAPAEVPVEAPAEVPVEAPAEVPVEAPAEVPVEVSEETPAMDEVAFEPPTVETSPQLPPPEEPERLEEQVEPALDLAPAEEVAHPVSPVAPPAPATPQQSVAPSGVEEPMQEAAAPTTLPPSTSLPEVPPPPAPESTVRSPDDVAHSTNWLDEEPAAESAEAAPGEDLFDDEEGFFDLAAELQEDLAGEADATPEQGEQPTEQTLEEIVEGFKKGVSENLSEEDSDTHYNLGIAYREMMLLDEAISEFQIAARDEKYLVDSCAMLGLCFQEKGLPELALKWYKKGLDDPGVPEKQALGMLYDIGACYLAIDDRESAYKTFVEIYGMNSSYRDVAAKMQESQPNQQA